MMRAKCAEQIIGSQSVEAQCEDVKRGSQSTGRTKCEGTNAGAQNRGTQSMRAQIIRT